MLSGDAWFPDVRWVAGGEHLAQQLLDAPGAPISIVGSSTARIPDA